MRINNNKTKHAIPMTCRPCFTNNDNDHYQGLLREMKCEFIRYDSDSYHYTRYRAKFNDHVTC